MAYQIGDRVGDYEIVDVLGAGGMGKVYKVRNIISERFEALKVLLPNLESDPELADRFMREIKVQASLHHPNIAALHTALRVNNQLLMLLEFVEGVTLEAELRRGRIPVEKGVDYIRQVLSALAYAHARGVVHRDIKPANMMLTPQGVVKLMDFGIARMAVDRKLTQTGRTVGSLYYMSPEQISGAGLDARSDLYSLGISLYELVTKTRPFQGDSDYSIMAAHLQAAPVPPIELDPTLPPMLNEIILMSIAKDPAQRFQSADAFRTALETVLTSLRTAAGSAAARKMASSATTAQAVAAPAAAAVPIAAEPRKSSGLRGVYMAIGSVVTLGVLAVAALQGPKWFGPSAASSVDPPQAVYSEAPLSQPVATPPAQEVKQPEVSRPAQSASVTPPKPKETVVTAQVSPQNQTQMPQPQLSEPQVPASKPPASAQAQPEPPQSAPVQPAVDEAKMNAVNEMRERLMLLGSRANAIRATLATLKQQQARQGVGLRQDVVTAEQRMEFYMDEAEAGVKASNPDLARKNLDSAELNLERLEKFLGR